MLKLYAQNSGRGAILAFAENEAEARQFMASNNQYDESKSVEEFEVKAGYINLI